MVNSNWGIFANQNLKELFGKGANHGYEGETMAWSVETTVMRKPS